MIIAKVGEVQTTTSIQEQNQNDTKQGVIYIFYLLEPLITTVSKYKINL